KAVHAGFDLGLSAEEFHARVLVGNGKGGATRLIREAERLRCNQIEKIPEGRAMPVETLASSNDPRLNLSVAQPPALSRSAPLRHLTLSSSAAAALDKLSPKLGTSLHCVLRFDAT